jgi:actin-related protein 5
MTIDSQRDLNVNNAFHTAAEGEGTKGPSQLYHVQDYPFKGFQPSRTDGYQRSTGGPGGTAIVIDNGDPFSYHYTMDAP